MFPQLYANPNQLHLFKDVAWKVNKEHSKLYQGGKNPGKNRQKKKFWKLWMTDLIKIAPQDIYNRSSYNKMKSPMHYSRRHQEMEQISECIQSYCCCNKDYKGIHDEVWL